MKPYLWLPQRRGRVRWGLCAWLGMCVCLTLIPAVEAGQIRALLIGVTQYRSLPLQQWLMGPAHDVVLLQELLTRRFRVDPAQIVTLAGWPELEHLRPTRANIVRAFTRMADLAEPGDQIVIFLAGHGSQQPATQDANEADGLDEIFLPADAAGWHGAVGHVENAIVDNEIRVWIHAIRQKGAFVWMIVDACHSGTMTRGAPATYARDRHIPSGVLVPEDPLTAAVHRVPGRQSPREVSQTSTEATSLQATAGGFVALMATQPNELTLEKPLPSATSPVHGLFTYTLVQVLQQSVTALTYRELGERLTASLRSQGYMTPTPLLEGSALDREVLGLRVWPERPRLLLGDRDLTGAQSLQAGHVHGLRPGTVLAVYPPAGTKHAERLIGHVRVAHVEAFTATVLPVPFHGLPAPKAQTLLRGARCQVVFVDYGEFRLKVALQSHEGSVVENDAAIVTHPPETGPQHVEAALAALEGRPGSLITRVYTAAEAEWYVRVVQSQIYLIPALGWDATLQHATGTRDMPQGAPTPFVLGAADAPDLAPRLQSALMRIARAHHLLRLTREAGGVPRTVGQLDIRVDLLRLDDEPTSQEVFVTHGTAGRVLHDGESVVFLLTNPTPYTLDITLLLINSGYGIRTLFPRLEVGDENRLKPQQQLRTPAFRVVEPFGPEQLVIIATKAGAGRTDFSSLEQSSLTQALWHAAHAPALRSPVGQLFQRALYGQGQVRGVAKAVLDTYTVRVLSWSTKRAAE